ncbi:hypothetical protein [Longitalea luteola]|uniref:hypothetical protein n=1 Tax=Longitalea luteola TaxID=2812563 RepID=UPI001F61C576|nr:hypothetical protein [Longitalea luteola]
MKKILFLLILVCLEKTLHAQTPYIYTIKADSVKITNTCDTAELIIENHTQNVPGFLFNKGRGRTEFRRISQLDDTSVVIGGDTIHLGRRDRHFGNADLSFTGDRIHDGAFRSINLINFGGIGFKSNTTDGILNADMIMDTTNGYSLVLKTIPEPGRTRLTSQYMNTQYVSLDAHRENVFEEGTHIQNSGLSLQDDNFRLRMGDYHLETGEGQSIGIEGGLPHDGPIRLEIFSHDGAMWLENDNSEKNTRAKVDFHEGDSLSI